MRKIKMLVLVMWAVSCLLGCGSGGDADESIACIDVAWLPDASTKPLGEKFQQISNCGTIKEAVGTYIAPPPVCVESSWIPDASTVLFGTIFTQISNCNTYRGGAIGTYVLPPPPCIDATWLPDASTKPLGEKFQQISNCGTIKEAVGTYIAPPPVCVESSWIPDASTVLFGTIFTQISNCNTYRGGAIGTYVLPPPPCVDISWTPDTASINFGDNFTQISNCGATRGAVGTYVASCVDSNWSPSPSTVLLGDNFVQTSNCGSTQNAVGSWNPWIDRLQYGTSTTTAFKTFADILSITSSSDGGSGIIAFGKNASGANNKGLLARLNSSGTELWRVQIDSPLGNTFIPHSVTSDGSRIIIVYERLPLHDWNIYAYDLNGIGGLIAETNIGYNLISAKTVLDGNNLVISRINADGTSTMFYASMVLSNAPLSVTPPMYVEFTTVNTVGVDVVGQGLYMEYDRTLAISQPATQWSAGVSPVVHDVVSIGHATYIAGTVNGRFVITQVGNVGFQNTANVPVGADKIYLGSDTGGNLYVSIGNRIGKINKVTGEFVTTSPPAIPANLPWYVSGTAVYFPSGQNLESLILP